jgi:hypothetical protein
MFGPLYPSYCFPVKTFLPFLGVLTLPFVERFARNAIISGRRLLIVAHFHRDTLRPIQILLDFQLSTL